VDCQFVFEVGSLLGVVGFFLLECGGVMRVLVDGGLEALADVDGVFGGGVVGGAWMAVKGVREMRRMEVGGWCWMVWAFLVVDWVMR
jgi:hypothetical protein